MYASNGVDIHRDLFTQAASLLQLLTRDRSVEVNTRIAWASTWTFLGVNGIELAAGFDFGEAERLVLDVATGAEQSVNTIAAALRTFAQH